MLKLYRCGIYHNGWYIPKNKKMAYMKEEPLGDVAGRIYLYSYPFKEGILEYRLLKDYVHTHKTSFKRVLQNEKLVERKYIDYWKIRDKGTKLYPKGMVLAKPDPLIRIIENNYKLDDFDRYALQKILSSDIFRKILSESIENSKTEIQNPVEHILTLLDALIIENKTLQKILNNYLKQYGFKFNFPSIKAYDEYCLRIAPKLKKTIPIIIKGKTIDKGQRDLILFAEDSIVIIIPERTYRKIKNGITSFSFLYRKFEKLYDLVGSMQSDFDTDMANHEKKNKILKAIKE